MPPDHLRVPNSGRRSKRNLISAIFLFLIALPPATSLAQLSIHGEGDNIFTVFPEPHIVEGRGRGLLKLTYSPNRWLFLKASGYGEFLFRSEVADGSGVNFRPHETYLELRGRHVEVKVGYSNTVWGVLDEIQPNDVINPIDVSWFFFEGRHKARLPTPLLSGRLYLPRNTRIELIAVPFFEKGVFDQLEEETSPFNISASQIPSSVPQREELPAKTLREIEYGGRLSGTFGQFDVSLYTYRGREDFPIYVLQTIPGLGFPNNLEVVSYFPRFTQMGADLETIIGKWGLRFEGAYLPEDSFQHPMGFGIVDGNSFQMGMGMDRAIGDQTLYGNAVYHRRQAEGDFLESDEELSLVAGFERSFRYELDRIRLFTVYNPVDMTLFLRWNGKRNLFRNFWVELSGGLFFGSGNDLIGRFESADFVTLRGKYYY
jgi:hypothetical protein